MKKFLEELKNAPMNTYDIAPTSSKARETLNSVRAKYLPHVGKQAIHTSKVSKETRVVVIEEVGSRFIVMSYPYYGNLSGRVTTTVNYNALLAGDSTLEVDDDD